MKGFQRSGKVIACEEFGTTVERIIEFLTIVKIVFNNYPINYILQFIIL